MEIQDYVNKIGNECFLINDNKIIKQKIAKIRIAINQEGVQETEYGVLEYDYNMNLERLIKHVRYWESDRIYLDKNEIIENI